MQIDQDCHNISTVNDAACCESRNSRPNQSLKAVRAELDQRGPVNPRQIDDRGRSNRRPVEEHEGIFRLAYVSRGELPTRERMRHGLSDCLQLVAGKELHLACLNTRCRAAESVDEVQRRQRGKRKRCRLQ